MSITVSLDKMAGAHRSFFPGYKDAHQKLRFMQGFLPQILSFILVKETCFHVTVVTNTNPKFRGESQTAMENSTNFKS